MQPGKILTIAAAGLLLSACTSQVAQVEKHGAGLGAPGYDGVGRQRIPAVPGSLKDFNYNVGNKVLFPTDQTSLTSQARQTLTQQARWLNQYPQYTITVEGHADERGTRAYNLGLGAKRAQSIKSFLISQGVRPARLRSISYGKERPVSVCNDISCWSQNRRGVTILNKHG